MLQALLFLGIVLLVVGPIHWYIWKRLVKDTTRPGRWRKVGTTAVIALVAVLIGALVVPRVVGAKASTAVPLAGYLWLAVMFYLLVILLVLEIPRLIAGRVLSRNSTGSGTVAAAGAAKVPMLAMPSGATASPDAAVSLGTGSAEPGAGRTGDTPARGSDEPDGTPDDPARRLLLARGAAIFAGLTAVGITGYGVKTALGDPVLKRIQIPLAKLPRSLDGYRIALVSDIHLGPLTGIEHARRIVRIINGMDADLVAIVGDLVDGSVAELGAQAAPLRDLRSRDGAYFVTGNHEYFSGADEWVAEVERLGINALRNERLEIRGLDLAGINDITGGDIGDDGGPDYERTLGGRDRAKPVVLLAHQPVTAREAAKYGVDLQLSGHTHGGQMVPFNYIAALQQPVISGLGNIDGTQVYVTNGAGFWGPPVRVGAPPDITLVQLRTT